MFFLLVYAWAHTVNSLMINSAHSAALTETFQCLGVIFLFVLFLFHYAAADAMCK